MKTRAASIAICFLASTASAQQPSIFIDVGSLAFGSGVPSAGYAAAAPFGGQWNALDAETLSGMSTFTTAPLMDTSGATTSVTATYDGLGSNLAAFEFDGPTTMGDDQALLDDVGFGLGPSEFRFNGLPTGFYDVYTYAMAPDAAFLVTSVDVQSSLEGSQNVAGNFSAGFVLGDTHAFHTVLVLPGQPLVIEFATVVVNNSFNGVQIVPSDSHPSLGTSYCGPAVIND